MASLTVPKGNAPRDSASKDLYPRGTASKVIVPKNEEPDYPPVEGLDPKISSETITKEPIEEVQSSTLSSYSSYASARESQLSSDVDRWIAGGSTVMESTGVQNSRSWLVQRSTLAMAPTLRSSGVWCILALVLPLFSVGPDCTHWRCGPSTVLTTAELLFAQISIIVQRIRNHIRLIARDQVARNIFAAAMDIVLVAYAFGFLVLSMYQASIIG